MNLVVKYNSLTLQKLILAGHACQLHHQSLHSTFFRISFPEEACPHTPLTVAYLCTQYATLATLPSNCLNQEMKLVAVQAPFNLQIKRIQIPGILPAKTSPDMMNMLKCMRLNMDPIP